MFKTYFDSENLFWLLSGLLFILFSLLSFFVFKKHKTGVFLLVLGGFLVRIFMALLDPYVNMWDEQFHAVIAKNMLETSFFPMLFKEHAIPLAHGNWALDHIWLHKQPLYLWQIALSFKLLGINEFTLRLPDILMTTLIIVFIYRIGKITVNETAGFIAAFLFVLARFPLEMVSGSIATDHNDTAFLFYISASLWSCIEYFRSGKTYWLFFIGAFAGMAVLVKWVMGFLVFIGWGFVILSDKERRRLLRSYWQIALSFILSCCVFIPWQIFILLKYPAESAFEYHETSNRLFEVSEGHEGPWWYYFDALHEHYGSGDLFPYIIGISFILLLFSVNKIYKVFFFASIVVVYGVFSFAATKMICYTIIVCPIVFVGLGNLVEKIFAFFEQRLKQKMIYMFGVIAFMLAAGYLSLDIEQIQENHTTWKVKEHPYNFRELRMVDKKIYQMLPDTLGKGKWAIFYCRQFDNPMVMFYTDYTAYDFMPNEEQIAYAKKAGWKIAVFTDYKLPDFLKNDPEVKKIYEPVEKVYFQYFKGK